jgi:acyl-CoA reductase-like NAD-dependent aldehyde dehydrogenase
MADNNNNFFTFSNTINGAARSATRITQAINPSNKQRLWDVPVASEEDVNEAVTAANRAFPSWSRTPWSERAKLLSQAREALAAIKDDMASVIMQENGKPVGS